MQQRLRLLGLCYKESSVAHTEWHNRKNERDSKGLKRAMSAASASFSACSAASCFCSAASFPAGGGGGDVKLVRFGGAFAGLFKFCCGGGGGDFAGTGLAGGGGEGTRVSDESHDVASGSSFATLNLQPASKPLSKRAAAHTQRRMHLHVSQIVFLLLHFHGRRLRGRRGGGERPRRRGAYWAWRRCV